jgi:mono/diheme cytochrome c family protein
VKLKKVAAISLSCVGAGFLGVLAVTHYSDSNADATPLTPLPATPELIQRGAYLAKLGDCAACHSLPDNPEFSGGLKMGLPIGSIYTTNITPDPKHGIGTFTLTDFDRALRFGVSKGHTLYPAMPFASYANITADDVQALYAYFMHGVAPAAIPNRRAEILFPLSLRFPLTVWRWLFAPTPKPFDFASYADAQVAKGAYFIEGLGHCGECHTPRGIALEMKSQSPQGGSTFLAGSVVENYFAPSLRNEGQGSLAEWNIDQIALFLHSGVNTRGIAFGSMTEVIEHSTQYMTESDLQASAKYLKGVGHFEASPSTSSTTLSYSYDTATAKSLAAGNLSAQGAATYIDNCAACHRPDGTGYEGVFPTLAGNPAVESADPLSLATIVLTGSKTAKTHTTPAQFTMPAFSWRLSDQEIADVLTFIRNGWGNKAAPVNVSTVTRARALAGHE